MAFPIDPKYIDQAEAKLDVKFPIDFREAMVELNGGEVDMGDDHWQLFPFFDTSDKKRLKRTANDIVRETASAKGWSGFPPAGIVIASNGSGDLAILLPSEETPSLQDAVFRWHHETGETSLLSSTIKIWVNTRG